MTDQLQKQLANALWQIADILRGSMNADDFRDYMLCFIFLRYISDDYEAKAQDFLGTSQSLVEWYAENSDEDITFFEEEIKRISYYVIKPKYLWSNIVAIAKTDGVVITQKIEVSHEDKSKLKANLAIRNLSQLENKNLLVIEEDGLPTLLQKCFRHIEEESFAQNFRGLFSEINLSSDKLGKTYTDRNKMLCKIISEIEKGFTGFSLNSDIIEMLMRCCWINLRAIVVKRLVNSTLHKRFLKYYPSWLPWTHKTLKLDIRKNWVRFLILPVVRVHCY